MSIVEIVDRPDGHWGGKKCNEAVLRAIFETIETGRAVVVPNEHGEPADRVRDRYRQALRARGVMPHCRTVRGELVMWAVKR